MTTSLIPPNFHCPTVVILTGYLDLALKRKPVFSRKYDVISLSELRNTSGVEEYLVGKETIHSCSPGCANEREKRNLPNKMSKAK